MNFQRVVWQSDLFKRHHPEFSEIINDASSRTGANWVLWKQLQGFSDRAAKLKQQKRQCTCIAFVVKSELAMPQLVHVKNKLTGSEALTVFDVKDVAKCRSNVCGR